MNAMQQTISPKAPPPATMPVSASSQPLRLRQRADLRFYPQTGRDGRVWVVKDPLSLAYFQFREEEYQLLRWLDGHRDLNELIWCFERRFAPQRLTPSRLMGFVTKLHRSGLVLSDTVGQGHQLQQRSGRQRMRDCFSAAANPLAIRLPGIDPSAFLDWLLPRTRWMYAPQTLAVCGLFIVAVLVWMVLSWNQMVARFPDGHLLVRPANVLLLGVVLAGTKVLHELAHALTCRYHGATCHRIGLMLLVFTPCLYCDVSDAWTVGQRWKRLSITAAGMLAELFLAAVCTVFWWFSQPGIANSICFNVMLVCSLGTVLINANPLMRYDGYYLLSDLLRYPNLWQHASDRLRRSVWSVCFGIQPDRHGESRRRTLGLVAYKLVSSAYRIIVVTAILYLAHCVLKPRGLEMLAWMLTASVATGFLAGPATAMWRTASDPLFRRQISRGRLLRTGVVATILLAGMLLVPFPRRVTAPVSLEAKDAKRVYVTVPGRLRDALTPGTPVRRGETLASLENLALQRQLESVRGQVLSQSQRIRGLESLRSLRAEFADQLPTARELLKDLRGRQSQLEREIASLTLTAPIDGIVIEPPSTPTPEINDGQLARWSGTPLDPCNRGATLQRQTLLCLVGPDKTYEAVAYIHQSDIADVSVGQTVKLRLQLDGWRSVTGKVRQLSLAKIDSVPEELAFDGQVANRMDQSGVARPDETWYRARIEVIDPQTPLLIGARGTAKVCVDARPLAAQLWRFLQRTFQPVL